MFVRFLAVAAIAAMAVVGTAQAQITGQSHRTTNDLNLRAGAGTGTGSRVIAVIPRGHPVQLYRCNAPVTWCNVNFRGLTGWVSARYLTPRPGFQMPQPVPPIGMPQPVPPFPPGPPFPPPGGPFPPFPPPGGPFPPFPPPGGPSQPPIGTITVSGTLTPEGVQCQALRGQDGRLYTLAGSTGPFRNGDRVRVRGQVAQMSICMQGTTINVEAIQPWF